MPAFTKKFLVKLNALIFSLSLFTFGLIPNASAERFRDITYCTLEGTELKLNLTVPDEGDGPFPAIVFIHGGGWSEGSRSSFHRDMKFASNNGFVGVTIDYRLVQEDLSNALPAALEDVKCAVHWVRANAAQYNINPRRIGASGYSAGGHLALMLALTTKDFAVHPDDPNKDHTSRVQAVATYSAVTDLAELYLAQKIDNPHAADSVKRALGAPVPDPSPSGTAAQIYYDMSPTHHLTSDDPPILLFHGTNDETSPFEQALLMHHKAEEIGAHLKLFEIPDMGHSYTEDAFIRSRKKAFVFFGKTLK